MQPKTKEALPAGSTVITAIVSLLLLGSISFVKKIEDGKTVKMHGFYNSGHKDLIIFDCGSFSYPNHLDISGSFRHEPLAT